MQAKHLSILLSVVFAVSIAFGQASEPSTSLPAQEIIGAGTAQFLARFTGPYRIGDSLIFQAPGASIGIGTTAPHATLNVEQTGQNVFVIRGTVKRTKGFSAGVVGEASNANAFGVLGTNTEGVAVSGNMNSGGGWGVIGNNFGQDSNSGGGGVEGLIEATTGFNTAVRGTALGTSGPSVGVFGEQFSSEGQAGLFINRAGGDILHGRVSQNPDVTVFRVDGNGTVYADGGFQPGGADFAESMAVNGDRTKYAAGDLLVIDPSGKRRLALAQQPYSTLVAGIYSTKPGMLGSTRKVADTAAKDQVPLAVVGIVPCKVSAENGPIEAGDLLVASSTPGHAMKATDRSKMVGAVVGKALEPLREGKGVVQVLVTLQ